MGSKFAVRKFSLLNVSGRWASRDITSGVQTATGVFWGNMYIRMKLCSPAVRRYAEVAPLVEIICSYYYYNLFNLQENKIT